MQHTEINEDRLLLYLSLGRITFLSFEEKKFLENNLDSFNKLALMSIEDISKAINRVIKKSVWNGQENLRLAKATLHYCKLMNFKILMYFDEKYPELLRQISDPPYLLFCRGNENILCEKSVSVVGTRKLSPQGKEAAFSFAYDAVMNGCNVVSGLAHGADSYAHKGAVTAYFDALEKGNAESLGKTIAVLPSSIDEIVPYGNRRLAEQILQSGGCIISEYEPKLQLATWHYVGRNRIIAGLSPATVVVEAPAGSGALITADFALDYNRDLMFHAATFGELAKKVSEDTRIQLQEKFAQGLASKYKVENDPEKFLEAGAPIITGYEEYCKYLLDYPNMDRKKDEQGLLFED